MITKPKLLGRGLLANLQGSALYVLFAACFLLISAVSLGFLAGAVPFSEPLQNHHLDDPVRHSDSILLNAGFPQTDTAGSSLERDSSGLNGFSWYYDGDDHFFTYSGPVELYEYYLNKPHDRTDYNQYALSEYDRWAVRALADYFKQYGRQKGHSEEQITEHVISFVQSVPYSSDEESAGAEDYPRYPVETLTDRTGDCEDTAILAAAILYELGYDSVLILVPQHMALGIRDSGNYSGQFYEYNGGKYYYVETTSPGHKVGSVPDSVDPRLCKIYPMVQIPEISASFSCARVGSDADYSGYSVSSRFLNDGPGIGKNITVTVHSGDITESNFSGPNQTVYIGDISEDGKKDVDFNIQVPNNSGFVYFVVDGDNFDSFTVSRFYSQK